MGRRGTPKAKAEAEEEVRPPTKRPYASVDAAETAGSSISSSSSSSSSSGGSADASAAERPVIPLPSSGSDGAALLVACANLFEMRGSVEAVKRGDRVIAMGCADLLLDDLAAAVGPAGAVVVCLTRSKALAARRNKGPSTKKSAKEVEVEAPVSRGAHVHYVEVESAMDVAGPLVRALLGEGRPLGVDGPTVTFMDHGAMAGHDMLLDLVACVNFLRRLFPASLKLVCCKSSSLSIHAGQYASAAVLLGSAEAAATFQSDHARASGGALRVIGAVEVKQYREAIPLVVRAGDRCLEIGCHLGTTTKLLYDASTPEASSAVAGCGPGACVGVDVGHGNILSATKMYSVPRAVHPLSRKGPGVKGGKGGEGGASRGAADGATEGPDSADSSASGATAAVVNPNPGLSFATADGYDMAALARIEQWGAAAASSSNGAERASEAPASPFTVCFVDVGGMSGEADGLLEAIALIRTLASALPHLRAVVIKSLCVQRHARRLVQGHKFLAHIAAHKSKGK